MNIENNILKYYLGNVYFITGTAYAGKSTTVKMLAERYNMVFCGENYHSRVSDVVAMPEHQPDESCDDSETVMENYRQGLARINSPEHYRELANSGFFTVVRENIETDTREEVCDTIAKHFGLT